MTLSDLCGLLGAVHLTAVRHWATANGYCESCLGEGLVGPLKRERTEEEPTICPSPAHGGAPSVYLVRVYDDEDLTLFCLSADPIKPINGHEIAWYRQAWADRAGRRWWRWTLAPKMDPNTRFE